MIKVCLSGFQCVSLLDKRAYRVSLNVNITFHDLTASDLELHKDFIYVALWDHPDDPRRPRSVLDTLVVKAYYMDWGQDDDMGIIAYIDDRPAGFIQLRVKESVTEAFAALPELAISVFPSFQGKGVATMLFKALRSRAEGRFKGIRLGVNPKNLAAISLYEKLGFQFYAFPDGFYPQMVLLF